MVWKKEHNLNVTTNNIKNTYG